MSPHFLGLVYSFVLYFKLAVKSLIDCYKRFPDAESGARNISIFAFAFPVFTFLLFTHFDPDFPFSLLSRGHKKTRHGERKLSQDTVCVSIKREKYKEKHIIQKMPESTSETVEAVPVNPVGFETPKNSGS